MTITRHRLGINDTGTIREQTSPLFGTMKRVVWYGTGDTGAFIGLHFIPEPIGGDTGPGDQFWFSTLLAGGHKNLDTGLFNYPCAGDRIKVRINGDSVPTTGTLYVYVDEGGN